MLLRHIMGTLTITIASVALLGGCGDDETGGGDGNDGGGSSTGGSSGTGASSTGGTSTAGCSSASDCPEVQCAGENFPSRTCAAGRCRLESDCSGAGGAGGA